MTTDPDFVPPPRSLVSVQPLPPDQGGGVLAVCDCGTSTHLVLNGLEHLTETREMAFTCDGCQSVHWFIAGQVPDA